MTDSLISTEADAATPPADAPTPGADSGRAAAYRVLARRYRPADFSEMIGQEALVRTLTNAIASGRLAHAFLLTGVRGVGKTTTARIIARMLNCVGPDGTGGPTATPCGRCEPCRTIAQDRNVDVIEMDAASRNGVDDIREIVDAVRYGPTSSRYKVYIIDEVHMLSKAAFNALLKTLEEPPEHVKFVLATTEIRKVPVTVLSRCQRFDLRRIEAGVLARHFLSVAGKEQVDLEPEAAALIARAADGSARDGMSLLDQAIALGGGRVTAVQVADMLGLADRGRTLDLLEAALTGRPADALAHAAELARAGADPQVVMQDLLDLVHTLTRFKVVPGAADDAATPEIERGRGAALAGKLSMAALARAWQLLLKGHGEVLSAPLPQQAAEMAIIRLAYAADLPTPGDLVRQLADGAPAAPARPGGGPAPGGGNGATGGGGAMRPMLAAVAGGRAEALAAEPLPAPSVEVAAAGAAAVAGPRNFRELVALFAENREGLIYGQLYGNTHLVRFAPGHLEIRPGTGAGPTLANRVGALLNEWTGQRWMVSVSAAPGAPTLAEEDRQAEIRARDEAASHPVVKALMELFPGARIETVRDLTAPAAGPGPDAAPDDETQFGDAQFGDEGEF